MAPAGGYPSWQAMVSVRTFIVPPGPCPTPADTPGTSPAATTSQVTASIHDFAGSLAGGPPPSGLLVPWLAARATGDGRSGASSAFLAAALRLRGLSHGRVSELDGGFDGKPTGSSGVCRLATCCYDGQT